ncbi:MAG: hypothetical protein LBE75_06550 [Burkholderiales bacterium]|nr:hypothetical protein [Burkholderiales bacterium]
MKLIGANCSKSLPEAVTGVAMAVERPVFGLTLLMTGAAPAVGDSRKAESISTGANAAARFRKEAWQASTRRGKGFMTFAFAKGL